MSIDEWLYPKHCPVCLDIIKPGGELICPACRNKIRYVKNPVCYKCGKPLRDETKEYCSNCQKRMPSFEKGIAWAEYSSFYIRRMLSEVKYHGKYQLLDFPCFDFASGYKEEVKQWNADILIPVPVHPSRFIKRGYNQAEEICKRLSKVWEIPYDGKYLIRSENTVAQKELTDEKRAMNLFTAFSVEKSPEKAEKYKNIILVDDIYTTGSTAEACTRILKKAGAGKVYAAFIATGKD